MKIAAILLLVGAAARGADQAFVLLVAARDRTFVQEPVRVTLRVGIETEFFRSKVVQLFHQRLDLPVQVEAGFDETPPNSIARGPGTRTEGQMLSLALDGEVVNGRRVAGPPGFTVVEIEHSFVPTEPGTITLPAPKLRFVHGTRFRDDFFEGRIAVDRQETVVEGEPLVVTVAALPDEGRRPEFAGAVGRFRVRADTEVSEGATLRLRLHIEGEGNLDLFDTPRLDELPGFHVYGMIDDRGASHRTITYEIAPLDATPTEIPAIPFAYFDPNPPPQYRTARTAAIPLETRARAADAVPARKPVPAPPGPPYLFLGIAFAVVTALILALRRRRDSSPAEQRVLALRLAASKGASGLATPFAEYLAAHLHSSAAAVISPDLPARLERAGVPPELAARTARFLESLVGMRYGGAAAADAEVSREANALIDALEVAWKPQA